MIQEPSLEISVINKEFDTLTKLKQQLEMNIPEPIVIKRNNLLSLSPKASIRYIPAKVTTITV